MTTPRLTPEVQEADGAIEALKRLEQDNAIVRRYRGRTQLEVRVRKLIEADFRTVRAALEQAILTAQQQHVSPEGERAPIEGRSPLEIARALEFYDTHTADADEMSFLAKVRRLSPEAYRRFARRVEAALTLAEPGAGGAALPVPPETSEPLRPPPPLRFAGTHGQRRKKPPK